jgi:hypothetical protein
VGIPHFQLVPGSRLVRARSGGVGWRLLGANNRELGRSPEVLDDAEAALVALQLLRTEVGAGIVHVQGGTRGKWSWYLVSSRGALLAVSGRGFRDERACRLNVEQFRCVAPDATVR